MPLFSSLPPNQAPLHIPHLGVIALLPPPPKPMAHNQVPALLTLASTSTNTGSNS